ncbi:MAG: peptidylprolyl isomerase, partial [Mycoplasmatota bacterium]|nr:peptidylprolyl isomerase [Mycoplasmatota bacterium]
MKNKKLILSISCLLLISLFVTGCKQEIEVKDGSKVAVSVDGGKITATDYYNEIKQTNISVLIDMIDHKLFDKKYPRTDEEDERVEKIVKQLKEAYTDETTLNAALNQFYGVSTEEELEDMIRLEYKRELAIKDYIAKNIKDSEIEKYYKENIFGEVEAKHILIIPSVSDDADDDEKEEAESQAKKTAEEIIKKLEKGEDFSKLAKKYSQDTATASKGGDLGYFELDEMVEEFSNAVKELDTN